MGMPDGVIELPASATVTDASGKIIAMNRRACETFEKDDGAALIGTNVFDCHPEPSKTKTLTLYEKRGHNHYTIRKRGQKKFIHQLPWYQEGHFAGFVELSIHIPDELPHFERD